MKRAKKKVITASAEQLERWTERAQYLGYGSVSEWARVTLLQARRSEGKATRRNEHTRELAKQARADRIRATMMGESEAFDRNMTSLRLTEGEHAELDRDDFSAWARGVLDAAVQH